ncbi:MAG: ABC transporter permease [Parcubacteria group bacterium]|nr:ABC transporter permease [Parcubacteria group bacterium]
MASIVSDSFFTIKNITNMLRASSVFGILALGLTIVMITGEIDISIGAALIMTTVAIAKIGGCTSFVWAILGGLAVGIIVGMINGYLVGIVRTNSLIITLGMQAIYIATLVFIQGGIWETYKSSYAFLSISRGSLWKIPIPVIIFSFTAFILYILLSKTVFGKYIYATGGDELTTWLAGISVNRVKFMSFVICGLCIGVAAVILASRIEGSAMQKGELYLFDTLTAVILGGNSLYGGRGGIGKTILGVLTLAVLTNMIRLMGVSYSYEQFSKGVLLIIAVTLNIILKREEAARFEK